MLHFTAKPATTEFAARFPNADAGKPVPTLSAEREFRPLHPGDSDELGLFEIPGMGLSVTDSIHVTVNDGTTTASAGPLRFAGLKVSINGPLMQFTVDNDNYECTADAPILVDAEGGEVWVYHDPAYTLAGNWTQEIRPGEPMRPALEEFFTAASDSLHWWLP